MTPPERREAARLRSERWRRAHGIMPRRPAQRPWLAEGISRSTKKVPRLYANPHKTPKRVIKGQRHLPFPSGNLDQGYFEASCLASKRSG